MTAKHTTGPWYVADDHPQRACIHIRADCGLAHYEIAGLYTAPNDEDAQDSDGVYRHDHERMANARLIASAPELLNALMALADAADVHGIQCDAARAAIARATGEQA